MLRVLPLMFKPIKNLICCNTGLMWVVNRATSLFNSFCSNVARQVARFLFPVFPYFKVASTLSDRTLARRRFDTVVSYKIWYFLPVQPVAWLIAWIMLEKVNWPMGNSSTTVGSFRLECGTYREILNTISPRAYIFLGPFLKSLYSKVHVIQGKSHEVYNQKEICVRNNSTYEWWWCSALA